ncbi:MAG: SbcC/MukB-like Walker B domain-containing protein [Clostridiales bacterium]|nr:SbcC/MukB-like Walker B domain-containing protein [Clostridiales bacterium]
MRPLKLRLKGLNSYTEEQVIDFEKLTQRGLFGIFGPTGSGKSSILDAMTLALYGEISRGTREFINTDMDELFVSYEFEIGPKSDRKKYIVERHLRRDKTGKGCKTDRALLSDVSGGHRDVICEKVRDVDEKIKEIIGLSGDDFTRSVVLPQGKFSEFLKLKGLERRRMLERIFRLEKYGSKMTDRIRSYEKENRTKFDTVSGQLSRYDNITEDGLKEKMAKLNTLTSEIEKLKALKCELDKKYEEYKDIWDLQEELALYKKKLQELVDVKKQMDEKRRMLKYAKSAITVKPFADDINETSSKIKRSETRIPRIHREIADISKELEKIEKRYNDAYEKKEKELPGLIEKESKLKQAIEIHKEIENLESERQKLRNVYSEKINSINSLSKDIEDLLKDKKTAQDLVSTYEQRIDEIKVDPLYREKVSKLYETEKDYIDLSKKVEEKGKKIKELKESIQKLKREYAETIRDRDNIYKTISNLEQEKTELLSNCPGDNTTLLNKKDFLSEYKVKLNEALENDKKRDQLQKSFHDADKKKCDIALKIDELSRKLSEYNSAYENILKDIETGEKKNIAGMLAGQIKDGEPCPVCGSIHHPNIAEKIDSKLLDDKYKARDLLKEKIDKKTDILLSLKGDLAGAIKEENVVQEELKTVSQKLNGLNIEILKETFERYESEFEALKKSVEKWNQDKADIENKLIAGNKEKSSIDAREARLSEGLKRDGASLSEITGESDRLRERFNIVFQSYMKAKEELNVENIEMEIEKINGFSREENTLRKKIKSIGEKINLYEKKKEEIEIRRNDLSLEKAKIEESGKVKREVIDRDMLKFNELSEGREPLSYREYVINLMERIKSEEAALKQELKVKRDEKQKMLDERISEEKNLRTLKELFDEQHEKLTHYLDEYGFEDAKDALNHIVAKDEMDALEGEIKSYDDGLNIALSNVNRVLKRLGQKSIDDEMWDGINKKRKESEYEIEERTKLMAGVQNEISHMKKELEEVNILSSEKKKIEHTLDLLNDLDNLTQANRFVEFVSTSRLKYIAIEASKRLKDITSGRYALELDDNCDFVMRDDFNGGVRRAVDTLSGGETFLTSLCLALALSSHIQLKGSAPLEFFFLDEGFGTLDNELLETVMTSLEKLRSDRLSIGIISHVEELKNRVPVKLIVTPARPGGGGTKVQIEYS